MGPQFSRVVVAIGAAVSALGCSDRTTAAPSADAGSVATSASEGGAPDANSVTPIPDDGSIGGLGVIVESDAEACPTNPDDGSGADSAPVCDPSCQGTCIRGRCLVPLFSGQNSNVNGMAIDSTSAYWTEFPAGTVKKVPLGGGAVTTLASRQAGPLGIVAGKASVYWTGESETQNPGFR